MTIFELEQAFLDYEATLENEPEDGDEMAPEELGRRRGDALGEDRFDGVRIAQGSLRATKLG